MEERNIVYLSHVIMVWRGLAMGPKVREGGKGREGTTTTSKCHIYEDGMGDTRHYTARSNYCPPTLQPMVHDHSRERFVNPPV